MKDRALIIKLVAKNDPLAAKLMAAAEVMREFCAMIDYWRYAAVVRRGIASLQEGL